jgi:hypothetical protein
MLRRLLSSVCLFLALATSGSAAEPLLRIAIFQADVTPPLGTPLCDALCKPARTIVDPLSARGIVLLTAQKPIVLCAVDWVGIGNSGYDAFRDELARAAGTTRERAAVHCLHQHDAPGCDFQADELLRPFGLGNKLFDPAFARQAMAHVAKAVRTALGKPLAVTHAAFGKAQVAEVASNRRVLGPDGKVKYVRYSATKDPKVRAEPEGVIDPYVRSLTFFDGTRPLVTLTYYATHPQSYYGGGGVSCDFPGLARNRRDQEQPEVAHIHFNGASGNITAGKYNDGSPANRALLAGRLATGMKEAFESAPASPIAAADVEWRVTAVALPVSPLYTAMKDLEAIVADPKQPELARLRNARNLAWAQRCAAGDKLDLACLRLGPGYVLFMPGELFIEYQLLAQKMKPNNPVLMAAYGDYGPGYIGTAVAYTQGGYETGPVSRVGPGVEDVLTKALRVLLK